MMVPTGLRVASSLCLAFLVVASDSSVEDLELRARFSDLEQLVKGQLAEIESQRARLDVQEKRLTKYEAESQTFRRLANSNPTVLQSSDPSLIMTTDDIIGSLDAILMLLSGAMVMFMQAGFAMLEAGQCRAKNVQSILLKNVVDVCVGTMGWWALGFAFAYGNRDTDGDGFMDTKVIGTEHFFSTGFSTANSNGTQNAGAIPGSPGMHHHVKWFFQWAFCTTSATIVSGGLAERVQFPAYAVFSFAMTAFMYPAVVGSTWGGGFLSSVNDVGFTDLAGGGIVHVCGGTASLIGSIVAGPRDDRWIFPDDFRPHNLPLVVLGTFILWFGWYGFNCGSLQGIHSASTGALAGQVAMNTTIAAAIGGLTVFSYRCVMRRKYDLCGFCNGILAGLVSITAGASNMEVGSAFATGLVGAMCYQGASNLLIVCRVDDPIDAFAIHGAAGAWGVFATALFDWGKGFDFANGNQGWECVKGGDGSCLSGAWVQMLLANLLEIVTIMAWIGVASTMLLLPFRKVGWLTHDAGDQQLGLDGTNHCPAKAYALTVSPKKEYLDAIPEDSEAGAAR